MNEVSRRLDAINGANPHAAAQLLPLVSDELRKLAAYRNWKYARVCLRDALAQSFRMRETLLSHWRILVSNT